MTDAAARQVARQMSKTATAWLEALTPDQRVRALWPAPGNETVEEERLRWFYTPTDHGGLPLGVQRPAQQRRAMQLVASGLSTAGYVTVSVILGWENVLDLVEDFSMSWARERARDPGLYYLRVFGDPRRDPVWGWRFGGHHVSLNNLVVDGRVRSVTPCFLGADPASAPGLAGPMIRPLAGVEDLARELVTSLGVEQLRRARMSPKAPSDIIGGNRPRIGDGDQMISLPDLWRGRFADSRLAGLVSDVSAAAEARAGLTGEDHELMALSTTPKGVAGADLDASQQHLLGDLVAAYTGRIPEGLAPKIDLGRVHVAWAGSLKAGQPHYYRLQGPGFLAEWDNTQRDANHGHSVWRDPDNDFGLDVLSMHRATDH